PEDGGEGTKRKNVAAWSLVIILSFTSLATAADNPFSARYRTALEAAGVHPTQESLAAFLRLHHVGPVQQATYDKLIADLGADDFFVREAATAGLLQLSTQAAGRLQQATGSPDPEVRWRAEYVLMETSKPRSDLLYAALVVIQADSLRGLADPLLGTAAVCQSEYLKLALSRALESTVTPADIPLLTRAIESEDLTVRLAAFQALLSIREYDATALAQRLLTDKTDALRLAAAEWLVRSGSRPAINALGELLDSKDVAIRNRSSQLVQGTLKITVQYSAYAEEAERKQQAAAVREVIRKKLNDAPPKDVPKFSGADLGRVLLCSYKGDEVFEVDGLGQKVNPSKLTGIADCQLLPDGRRLVSQMQKMRVVELDSAGQEVWKVEGLQGYPIRVRRLSTGNTLIVTVQGELQEFDPKGVKLWSSRFDGTSPRDVHHLPNGHILLVHSRTGQVVDLNEKREESWRSPVVEQMMSVCPTLEGTVLATTLKEGKIVELDRQGNVRPFPAEFSRPQQIQQLKDGRFLVLDAVGLHLIERTGKRIRTVIDAENLTRFDAADAVESVLP
ncbi:MAG: HEAT repeat domain-containing protein, partial [Planctomycetaceae bacterium]|nr:HEAT repeat domain-containing protein [Planctomycetaceae bacterium]